MLCNRCWCFVTSSHVMINCWDWLWLWLGAEDWLIDICEIQENLFDIVIHHHVPSLSLGWRHTSFIRLLSNAHDWPAASTSEAKALDALKIGLLLLLFFCMTDSYIKYYYYYHNNNISGSVVKQKLWYQTGTCLCLLNLATEIHRKYIYDLWTEFNITIII